MHEICLGRLESGLMAWLQDGSSYIDIVVPSRLRVSLPALTQGIRVNFGGGLHVECSGHLSPEIIGSCALY